MRSIQLHGALADKYGSLWTLDVKTPAEALRAINANRPGFLHHIYHSADDGVAYRILLDGRDMEVDELTGPFGRETFHLVPVVMGAGDGRNIAKAVVGAIIAVVAIALAPASGGGSLGLAKPAIFGLSYGTIALFGVSLALSGISGILANAMAPENTDKPANKPSYAFNGPVNTIAQGGCVPVGYGELIVGSYVISGGIETQPLALGVE